MQRLDALPELGDNLQGTEAFLAETLALEKEFVEELEHARELERIGNELVEGSGLSSLGLSLSLASPATVAASDTVEPKCLELHR